MQEAFEHAPVDQGTLLVLIVLADSADEGTRECWPSVSRIAARARLSERQVQYCLKQLSDRGIIEIETGAGRSGTNLYRLTRHEKWGGAKTAGVGCNNCGGGEAHCTGGVQSTSPGGVKPIAPEPSIRTINEPSKDCDGLFSAMEAPKAEKPNDDGFERFWAVYPLKTAKTAARKNWGKAIKKAPAETIIAAAERYAAWVGSAKPGEFRPNVKYPQGWLSDERWKDGIVEPPAPRRQSLLGPQFGEVVR